MKSVVADDEAVESKAAEGDGLGRRSEVEGVFNCFKGGHDVGVRAGAADASEKGRSGNGSFAADGLGVEALVFSDFEMDLVNLAVFNR